MLVDLSEVKESEFSPLPEGKYLCNITNAEVKETKMAGGKYIKAEFTISNGDMKGRKIWGQFNIANANPKAVEIGLQQLKSMLVSANYPDPNKLKSIQELCGLTVGVKTKIKKDDQYGDKAEVHFFFTPKSSDLETDQVIPF